MGNDRDPPSRGRSPSNESSEKRNTWRWVEQPPESYVLEGPEEPADPIAPASPGTAELLESWAQWKPGPLPLVLDADRAAMDTERTRKASVLHESWKNALRSPRFGHPDDRALHLGLLPQPFIGNLRTATIFVLLLNPGCGPWDYFGEFEVPDYRAALLANLRQEFPNGVTPFLYLDPRFSWHGGYAWWHGKLSRVMESLGRARGVPFAEARAELAGRLASIELFPYHSTGFQDGDRWLERLESVALARRFVSGVVLPRVREGKAILIVTRKAAVWNLPRCKGIVTYTPGEARAAHLSPGSRGGRAILRHLLGRR